MEDDDKSVILSFNDSLLRKSDLKILEGPHWINDNIIGFCFEYFEREKFNHSADKLSLVGPDVTQFIKLAADEELSAILETHKEKEFVLLAVNDNSSLDHAGGSHWSLLVYLSLRQEFQHYDSYGRGNSSVARKLAEKLQPYLNNQVTKIKYFDMETPQQENSTDCGLFTIAIAEYLCRRFCEGYSIQLPDAINQKTMKNQRDELKALIYKVKEEFAEGL